jgi:hypothetical protein
MSWPELDARIAMLEREVEADEDALKWMISQPSAEGGDDPLIRSPELRAIANRLPVLHNELDELRRWRDEPDTR